MATDCEIFKDWFRFYSQTKEQYNIQDMDIYNMGEKGYIIENFRKT
jgi:hypothetical protein